MDPIVALLIRYVIVPEVSRIIRGNPQITDEQILAQLPADIQAVIGTGQAFLDRTRA